jgi:hypothetical protein
LRPDQPGSSIYCNKIKTNFREPSIVENPVKYTLWISIDRIDQIRHRSVSNDSSHEPSAPDFCRVGLSRRYDVIARNRYFSCRGKRVEEQPPFHGGFEEALLQMALSDRYRPAGEAERVEKERIALSSRS